MTIPRLLISGIGKRNVTLRLLARECERHEVDLIGADASLLAPARAEIEQFEQLPLARDDDFVQRYAQLVADRDVRAVLTLVDPEIAILGELAAQGQLGDAVLLHPDADVARSCEDKFALHERMTAGGISTVPTQLSPLATFPHIRKDRRGSRSSGFAVVEAPESLPAEDGDYVYQPFHGGKHYCVDAYFSVHSGVLVDFCAKEVLAKQHGESYLLLSVRRDAFVDLIRQVGQELPLRGMVNLDVYDDGGGPMLMEINCRIGGNYPAAHAVGANLLRHVVREVVDIEAKEEFSDYVVDKYISKFIGFTGPYSWPPAPDTSTTGRFRHTK